MGSALVTAKDGQRAARVEGAEEFSRWALDDVRRAFERCKVLVAGGSLDAFEGLGAGPPPVSPTRAKRRLSLKEMGDNARQVSVRSMVRRPKRLVTQPTTLLATHVEEEEEDAAGSAADASKRAGGEAGSTPTDAAASKRAAPAPAAPPAAKGAKGGASAASAAAKVAAAATTGAEGGKSDDAQGAKPTVTTGTGIAAKGGALAKAATALSPSSLKWKMVRGLVQSGELAGDDATDAEREKRKTTKRHKKGKVKKRLAPRLARVAMQLEARRLEEQRIAAEEARLKELCSSFVYLNRRDFLQCFSDFSHIAHGAHTAPSRTGYLALPMSVFNLFAQGKDMVNVTQVLLMLALSCRGAKAKQLELCFDMFDVDGSGDLDQDEMIAFFITLVNGAFKLGLVKKRPPFNQLMHVASSCFEVADIDGDNSVSREEFVRWAVNHVASKALVSSFRTVADAERKVHARAARAARLGDVDSALNLVRTHAATDGMQEVLRKQRFHRMRKQRERLISGHHQLVRETQFTMHELKRIQTAFVKRAKGSATLDMDGFCDIMLQEWPSLKREACEAMFHNFDADNSMDVDYVELVTGLSKMADGKQEDKIGLLFDVLDRTGKGSLEGGELLTFLKKESEEFVHANQFVREILTDVRAKAAAAGVEQLDDTSISREEFVKVLSTDPIMYDCFAKSIVSENAASNPLVKELFHTVGGVKAKSFDLSLLGRIWEKCRRNAGADAGEEWEMTRETFRTFMAENFGTPVDKLGAEVERLFDELDTDHSGTLGMKELFTSLGHLAGGSAEEQANFFYNLFSDGSGDAVDLDFIMDKMEQTTEETQEATEKLEALVAELKAASPTGKLSQQDFQAAIQDRPELLHLFHRLLGTHTLSTSGNKAGLDSAAAQQGLRNQRESNEYKNITKLLKRSITAHSKSTMVAPEEPGAVVKTMKMNKKADTARTMGLDRFRRLSLATQHRFLATMQGDATREAQEKVLKDTPSWTSASTSFIRLDRPAPGAAKGMVASASAPALVGRSHSRASASRETASAPRGAGGFPSLRSLTPVQEGVVPSSRMSPEVEPSGSEEEEEAVPWFERLSTRGALIDAKVRKALGQVGRDAREALDVSKPAAVPKYEAAPATVAAIDHAHTLSQHLRMRKRAVNRDLNDSRKYTRGKPFSARRAHSPGARRPRTSGWNSRRGGHRRTGSGFRSPGGTLVSPGGRVAEARSPGSMPGFQRRKRGLRSSMSAPVLVQPPIGSPGDEDGGAAAAQVWKLPGDAPSPDKGEMFAFAGRRASTRRTSGARASGSSGSQAHSPVADKRESLSSLSDGSVARSRVAARSGSLLSTASTVSTVGGEPRWRSSGASERRSVGAAAAARGRRSLVRRGKVDTPPTDVLRVHGGMKGGKPVTAGRRATAVSLVLETESRRIARQVWLGQEGGGIDLPPGLELDAEDDDSEADDQAPAKHTPQQRIAKELRHVTPRTPVDDVFGLPFGIPLTVQELMMTETHGRKRPQGFQG